MMFQNWGFLLGEIWVLLLLAALLGLFAGWLIWSRREGDISGQMEAKDRQIKQLEASLADQKTTIGKLEGDLGTCRASVATLQTDLDACRAAQRVETPVVAPVEVVAEPEPIVAAPEPVAAEVAAPLRLDGPRGGVADDLKRIKGIGPQMEKLCNSLGFYHFDQIANWSDGDVAWVDQNLEGFTGRVVRDDWVNQAKLLATGAETEFSKRVDKGEVPSSN